MKKLFYLLSLSILAGCDNQPKPVQKKSGSHAPAVSKAVSDSVPEMIRYSDIQLEQFLDSVGNLPTQPLADKVSFGVDSIFKNQPQLNTLIAGSNFEILKRAAHKGSIRFSTAKRIFGTLKIDSTCNMNGIIDTVEKGFLALGWYSFDKNKNDFNEYAIRVGDDDCRGAELYFFKSNKIIAKLDGRDRIYDGPEHYKDARGKTVIYRLEEFDRGSGIWWYQFFFYQYDGDRLIPILNEVENANLLQPSPWGVRELWIESFVQKTNPLTIKMVYHQQLPDTTGFDNYKAPKIGPKIVNDSTIVKYTWNEQTRMLEGDYAQSKISKAQILSYYLVDNELLFINAYYKTLKNLLLKKNTRKSTLYYLNIVKNHECNISKKAQ